MSLLRTLNARPSMVALVAAAASQSAFTQIVANITCLSSFGWSWPEPVLSYCLPREPLLWWKYPTTIPTGTAVPNWAYLDVVSGNIFNATAAQLDGDLPEPNATSPLTLTSTASLSPSVPVSTTSTGSSPTTSKSSNVGATAGGVVGGIVVVGAIAGLAAWLFIRRRRSRRAPPAAFGDQPQIAQPARFYDPADPSTFPPPLSSTMQTTTSSINYQHSANSQGFLQQLRPGQYNGVPEI
ncbi:hypothetical protein CY34DRAFT_14524 [Suillus luteus UH-Slu-Lm8-n1]|uniref:Mid2 domain-containing protein n=1 Tax=Suillus luteus UH-Slu-Lm8-n1 TaxID=930992 RepID=A0A0D0ABT2_9AGAM|nr:hypothetical protein CY34DRAFT_14524 [Suillus luteus UH-Slu-Lm8-n1]